MNESRENILRRLRANRLKSVPTPPVYQKQQGWTREQRIEQFSERMQAVRGEVHRIARDDWVDWINAELQVRGLKRVLVGRGETARQFIAGASAEFEVTQYDRPVEEWKEALFNRIDFAITSSLAGLAETGSLVLWPNADEPRLMSLVPPLHIALLDAERLFDSFADLLKAENWAAGMPSNALLISGPSKTADIEQTLAYGIHGPKEMITLILE